MENSKSNRIPSLDGLRAISILLVLIGHLIGTANFPLKSGDYLNLGNLGVRVFFIISGFLITGILLNEYGKTSTIDLKKFYYRRTLRIFPPYYFFLAVVGILMLVQFLDVKLWEWFSSVFYLSNYAEIKTWQLGHTWSLAVEEQFYLIMPFLLFFTKKRKTFFILCAVIILAPFMRVIPLLTVSNINARWVSFGFQANADSLAMGCLLAFLRERLLNNQIYQKILSNPLFMLVPIVALLFNLLQDRPKIFSFFCITIINFCIVLCIDWAVTFHKNPIGKLLNSKPFVFFGMLSYSIYLWQQLFLNRNSDSIIATFPLNIILTIICAILSYYLIEKPSLKFRTKFEKTFLKSKRINIKSAKIITERVK